jgi:hypothetical protein
LTYRPETAWNFSTFVPDVIVLNLGTNEQISPNFNSSYVPALTTFLLQLSSSNGYYGSLGLPVPYTLMYCGPMVFDYCDGMAQAAAAATSAGSKAVFLGPINATLDGCAGHPGPIGQAQMATTLTAIVKAFMGW